MLLNFCKRFYYSRYKDRITFGFTGLNNFGMLIRDKVKIFVRTVLHLDIKKSDLVNNSSCSESTFFLGFNLLILQRQVGFFNSLKLRKNINLISRVTLRLNILKKNFSSIFLKRIKSELLFHFKKIKRFNQITSLNFFDFKLWASIFQLESVRSLSYYKVIFSDDIFSSLPNNLLFSNKFQYILIYRNYYFNSFIIKANLLLKKLLRKNILYIDSSSLSLDLIACETINEVTKMISFFSNSSSFYYSALKNKDQNLRLLFRKKKDLFENYNFDYFSFIDQNRIKILSPLTYIYYKLKFLGYVHPLKNRPIGNSKYLSFSDDFIIRAFGYISYMFLFWFRLSDNFISIKLLVEFLRQSCILTICRKHNKSRSWVYSIYSSNLLVTRGLFNIKSFFPTKTIISNIDKDFPLINYFFFVDEKFFLLDE
jgi:hypothetical protein